MNHIKLEQRILHIKVLNNLHANVITVRMAMARPVNWEGLLTHMTEINAYKIVN